MHYWYFFHFVGSKYSSLYFASEVPFALPRAFKQKNNEDNEISYLVCHMEKCHKTDIAPVEQENERNESYPANNPQIDCTRTRNNFNVIKRQCSYTLHINKRIAELDLPTKVRKDAVLMCSFVVGSDREFFKSLSEREQEKFFADCTRFFADRYGERILFPP